YLKVIMQNFVEKIKQFPTEPGIYLFYDKNKELIYVGKATSLRNRVQSYFRGARSMRPIEQMMHEVMDIKIKQTDSVLEAVILEANYIKKFLPKYNVDGKDDKSWNYVVITSNDFPQVLSIRQHEMDLLKHKNIKTLKQGEKKFVNARSGKIISLKQVKYEFGPYPGLKTREMMKLLNRLFFISTCKPASTAKSAVTAGKPIRPCLYRQIGQCLGVCTGEISSREYKSKVILPLVTFLRGGKKKLVKSLEIKMNREARKENFEEAGRLRNQISTLSRIHDIALLNDSFFMERGMRNVERGMGDGEHFSVKRIEGYDISNLGASGKVGSMVVFNNKEALKSEYRKFKIKTVVGQSDVDCLREVLERRITRIVTQNDADKWPAPDVILIDGGKPQVNAVMQILKKYKLDIPLVGIAKGPERKRNDFIFGVKTREFIKFVNENQDLLIRVRDEAHRFAIQYQRSLRKL
ncbi:MAG: GIY-YIG nuclease family protein, partial [Patescibacteria group bacterium]|nr:GIY-YIG nuclease family protein [Patescibacteria group bacterium]